MNWSTQDLQRTCPQGFVTNHGLARGKNSKRHQLLSLLRIALELLFSALRQLGHMRLFCPVFSSVASVKLTVISVLREYECSLSGGEAGHIGANFGGFCSGVSTDGVKEGTQNDGSFAFEELLCPQQAPVSDHVSDQEEFVAHVAEGMYLFLF